MKPSYSKPILLMALALVAVMFSLTSYGHELSTGIAAALPLFAATQTIFIPNTQGVNGPLQVFINGHETSLPRDTEIGVSDEVMAVLDAAEIEYHTVVPEDYMHTLLPNFTGGFTAPVDDAADLQALLALNDGEGLPPVTDPADATDPPDPA